MKKFRGNKKADALIIAIGLLVTVVVASIFIVTVLMYTSTYEISGTVMAKHIDNSGDGSHYIVVLESGQTLEVERNLFFLDHKYNPDLLYAQIQLGATYDFTCWGWQSEWFHWYPNVIAFVEN
jgi:flagellar basal body-associated protein FliL